MSRQRRAYTAVDPSLLREDEGERARRPGGERWRRGGATDPSDRLRRSCQTRLDEHVDTSRLSDSRYYTTTIGTQTEPDVELPTIHPTLLCDDDREALRTPARPVAAPASRAGGYNDYYQRLVADWGAPSHGPAAARHGVVVRQGAHTARAAAPAATSLDEDRQLPRRATVSVSGIRNRFSVDPGPPVFRAGRVGAPWRHVRQCLGNLGNHICFVDGSVKENDLKHYPPYGYVQHRQQQEEAPPPAEMAYTAYGVPQATRSTRNPQVQASKLYASQYNTRAKQGFRYWPQDKSSEGMAWWAGGAPKQTIQGRLMKIGVGY